jgi:hypothetical protein
MATRRTQREPLLVLVKLGYCETEPCGLREAPPREAVRRFQADQGLVVTGELDAATLEALADADARQQDLGDFPEPPDDPRLA